MIHLVVAHAAEARPLAARYGLREVAGPGDLPLFRGDGMALAVSGPGKLRTAAAAGYLFAAAGGVRDAAWLNLGMAGHAELAIGQALLAHKVSDAGSGTCWYPPMAFEPPCPTAAVLTVDRLEQDYEGERLYDTEAAGFFAAAGRFATSELVHACKIVIDNHGATLGEVFTDAVMEDLVAARLSLTDGLLAELRGLSEEVRRRRREGRARHAEGAA